MTIELIILDDVTIDYTPSSAEFKLWMDTALAAVQDSPQEGEIAIRIIGLEESAHLNETYRHKDGPTNVLSFTYEQSDYFTGDIAICADLVAKEARDQEKPLKSHWAHLIIHGILHLLGYDHIEKSDAEAMETLEINILSQLGYENPYF